MLAILRLLWRLKNPPPELPAGMTPLERVLARGPARRVLCAAVRDADDRMADVVRQELLGQLVRAVHVAQSHRPRTKTAFDVLALDASTFWATFFSSLRYCTSSPRSSIISGTRTMCCCACCRSSNWIGPNRRNDHDETPRRIDGLARRRSRLRPRLRAAGPATGYSADPQQSRLEFTGVQAGAEFKGVFHKFTRGHRVRAGRARELALRRADRFEFGRFDGQGSRHDHTRSRHFRRGALSDGALRHAQLHQDRRRVIRRSAR